MLLFVTSMNRYKKQWSQFALLPAGPSNKNYSSRATIPVREGNFQIVSLIAQIIFADVSLMKPVQTPTECTSWLQKLQPNLLNHIPRHIPI
jgi:hypothetical protein